MATSENGNGAKARLKGRRALPLFYCRPEPITAEGFKGRSRASRALLSRERPTPCR